MDRRQFLVRAGVAAGTAVPLSAIAFPHASRRAEARARPPMPPSPSWDEVRGEFDADQRLVHMAAFFLASHPRTVREALDGHRRGLDANPVLYYEENVARLENAVRASASRYLGAEPDDLAFTDSTTMGLGLVYGGMKLRPGQEILTDTHDHVATTLSAQYAAQRTGAALRQVPFYDDPRTVDADRIAQTVAAALRPSTRLLAMTWVHSGTGVKLPVRRIADVVGEWNRDRAPEERVLLAVDGVHGLGIDDVTMGDLGMDFFIAGTHKWIFGPRGTGLVWARPEAWAAVTPTIVTFDPAWRRMPPEQMPPAAFHTPGGFHSFEHRWAVAEAFDFHLAIGKARVQQRILDLNRRCKEELSRLPRVTVRTPMSGELSAGIICFEVAGLSPAEVVHGLHERRIVASVTPGFYQPAHARVAPGLLTSERDVEATVEAIAAL